MSEKRDEDPEIDVGWTIARINERALEKLKAIVLDTKEEEDEEEPREET